MKNHVNKKYLTETTEYTYRFLIADGNAAASRGGDLDAYDEVICKAASLKDAYKEMSKDYLDLSDDDLAEIEDEEGDLENYWDSFDLGGGDPYIVAIRQDDKLIYNNAEELDYIDPDILDSDSFYVLQKWGYVDEDATVEDDEDDTEEYNVEKVSERVGPLLIRENVVVRCERSAKEVVIPDSVTSIGDDAFSHCSSLTSITIPDSVTSIGNSAFEYCGLTNITIPDSVTRIGYGAFWSCNLRSITISPSVVRIGNSAFLGCTGLTNITFQGTKMQWNALSKGIDWDYGTGDYTVHCIDGTIKKNLKENLIQNSIKGATMKNTRPHDVNEGFNRMFKKLLNESLIVGVDGDLKKNLKENLIKEDGDFAELELRDADYVFDEATGDIHVAEVFKYHPKFKKYIDIKFVDDNDEKIYTYKIVEYDKDEPYYPWTMEYVSEKEEFVESKKALKESSWAEHRYRPSEKSREKLEAIHKAGLWEEFQDALEEADLEGIYGVFTDEISVATPAYSDYTKNQITASIRELWKLVNKFYSRTKESEVVKEEFVESKKSLKESEDRVLSTEEFLDWHDHKANPKNDWATLERIYDVFKENGCSEDDNVDDCYFGLGDDDKRQISTWILTKENFEESLKESDKPASISIEDCQKWVDYDMKRYGKISEKTNKIIRKAGFQIIKDQYGDYEVAAGRFE